MSVLESSSLNEIELADVTKHLFGTCLTRTDFTPFLKSISLFEKFPKSLLFKPDFQITVSKLECVITAQDTIIGSNGIMILNSTDIARTLLCQMESGMLLIKYDYNPAYNGCTGYPMMFFLSSTNPDQKLNCSHPGLCYVPQTGQLKLYRSGFHIMASSQTSGYQTLAPVSRVELYS
ncbi:hypothetical protein GEMRC1_000628 [Eukaryota sp. GEM-RC1]